MHESRARELWRVVETVHAVTYFAPECREASDEVGLRGFWMGYFASRAAPMGPVAPGVIDATFFNFHPAMVRRAVPDAWSYASPAAILDARSRGAAAVMQRLAPEAASLAPKVAPTLQAVIEGASGAGRPLFSANRDVVTEAGLEGLWQSTTTLREHRGDGHVAVLTEAGLDGCEAHVIYAASEGVDPELLQDSRGWSPTDWQEAVERLRQRGLVSADGSATETGCELREHIELRTDELAMAPWHAVGAHAVDEVLTALTPVARLISRSGVIRYPNPMGLPPVG